MTFADHKEITAKDCEAVADDLKQLAGRIREGDLGSFVRYWLEGGTEEGDAKIQATREMIVLRYFAREEKIIG
jgi:hypothetical protein